MRVHGSEDLGKYLPTRPLRKILTEQYLFLFQRRVRLALWARNGERRVHDERRSEKSISRVFSPEHTTVQSSLDVAIFGSPLSITLLRRGSQATPLILLFRFILGRRAEARACSVWFRFFIAFHYVAWSSCENKKTSHPSDAEACGALP